MKKLLVSIMMLTLVFSVSCTSKKDMDKDQETAEVTDPALDLEGADASAKMDSMETSTDTDDFAGDEEVIADTDELPNDSLEAESKGAEGEEVVLEDTAATATSDGSITADTSFADTSLEDTSTESVALLDTPAPKPNIPLQKIKDAPYYQGRVLLNTVYIGRPKDTIYSVSMKIFGSDRSADLKAANPFLNAREVKVGDKIYYNSPKRPQDAERMLTYYEDNGIPAQTYVSKSGENIRTISKNLLGHKDSWKEVWATNLAVDSKGELPEGTELRYWPDSGSQIPLADSQVPQAESSEVSTDVGQPQDVAANNAPIDDFAMPEDMGTAGAVAAEPPPPPPPPPPPSQPAKQVASSSDKDMTFMLSAGGLLLLGVGIILAVMRRSRSRKMSMNTNTQI
jgi:hypothetical protein